MIYADLRQVQCAHSRCPLKCHESCAPCIEKCTWYCEHKGACNMPCAAPCNRIPCNERCPRNLSCGHRCPGLCGETCPEGYCQTCSNRKENRVDLLEMKQYGEIDLDETPIVVLGCGHFFTAETSDGHIGMGDLYVQDQNGQFTELRDTSTSLAHSIPRCPDCQCPVRQFCTQRYNRVINRAIIDEMSKRFLVAGKAGLQELEGQIEALGQQFDDSRKLVLDSIRDAGLASNGITQMIKERTAQAQRLERAVNDFNRKVLDKHQPAQKLHDATVSTMRRRPLESMMADLNVGIFIPEVPRDRRVTVGGRVARMQAMTIKLVDRLSIATIIKTTKAAASLSKLVENNPERSTKSYFDFAETLIPECVTENLPKFAVEASLYYARLARSNESYCRAINHQVVEASAHVQKAKEYLHQGQELCKQPFQNAEALSCAIEESLRFLGKEWYEEVTANEIAAIKAAMVSGASGFRTHSGHWYNCENGHPVSSTVLTAFMNG